ncbi:sugar phosphate isomerase/epimerase [Microlunatus spumicola]|uniref:Sugar phosphate isomerase/epimerase n=1 Tax=Microlunatus spumicola TaxID=81499 RepID=A0ABP6WMT1_9ACTN
MADGRAAVPTPLEFVAACWTSAGDVMPLRGPDTSPLDVRTRIEAVSRAGYTGFGLTHADLRVARETVGLPTVAQLLRDNGLTTVQLERVVDWWTTGERRARSDALRQDLFDACAVLGVDNIKIGADDDGEPVTYDELCAGFDALADAGREAGVRIAYENTPFSPPPIRTTEQAIDLVTDVGNANGGLMLDVWHAYRGGTPYDALLRLAPERLFGVELDDGAAEVVGTQIEDTFDNRLFCGTGDFDVVSFVEVVRRLGWDGVWGIEHMSETDRRRPVEVVLREAREAAASCIAQADERIAA